MADEANYYHKLELLKQIKITLESLMFGAGSSSGGFANTWHKFNGMNIIFCKHILSILQDGFQASSVNITIQQLRHQQQLSLVSSSSSLDSASSPEQFQMNTASTSSSASNSRKTTQTSFGSSHLLNGPNQEAFWTFILFVLTDINSLKSDNRGTDSRSVESLAKKDFKVICNQLREQLKLNSPSDQTWVIIYNLFTFIFCTFEEEKIR